MKKGFFEKGFEAMFDHVLMLPLTLTMCSKSASIRIIGTLLMFLWAIPTTAVITIPMFALLFGMLIEEAYHGFGVCE